MLNKVINKKVISAYSDGESLIIEFDGGIGLAVHNERITSPDSVEDFVRAITDIILLKVVEREDYIKFVFDDGIFLQVLLDDDSFYGPEAMILQIPNKPIVVWN